MKKKILSMILTVTVTAALCACGGEAAVEPAAEPSTEAAANAANDTASEAATEEATTSAEETKKVTRGSSGLDDTEYDTVYADLYLTEVDQLAEEGIDQFALVDVDGDDIPELAASCSEGSWDKDQVFLYTVYDDELYLLASDIASGMEGHYLGFFEGENVVGTGGSVTGTVETFYTIEEGGLVELLALEAQPDLKSDDGEPYHYYVDNEEVDEKTFEDSENEFLKALGDLTVLDPEEMTIITFKNGSGEATDSIPYMSYSDFTDMLYDYITS